MTDILTDVIVFLVFFIPTVLAVMGSVWLMVWIWARTRRTFKSVTPKVPLDYDRTPGTSD